MTPVYKLSASSIKGRTNYGSMLAGNTAYRPPFDFESIATVSVGSGGSSSIDFTSIPGTYAHLQLRCIIRAASGADTPMTFNAGSFSRRHYLSGDGASASAGADTINGVFSKTITSDTANVFGVAIVDILDYANTNKTKTIRSLTGKDLNGSGQILLMSQLYDWTGAITSITLAGPTIQQYSHFALYGIKGA